MGQFLDEFEKMKAEAHYKANNCEDYLQDLKKDLKYYGCSIIKNDIKQNEETGTCEEHILYLKVPERSELTIEIEKNYCKEAAGMDIAKYIKEKILAYFNSGESEDYNYPLKVRAAVEKGKFWKLEDADRALEEYKKGN